MGLKIYWHFVGVFFIVTIIGYIIVVISSNHNILSLITYGFTVIINSIICSTLLFQILTPEEI